MHLLIQLIVISLCAVCKLIGETVWHNAQRFILPVVLGIGISYITGTWWLGLTILPIMAPISLGYDDYGKWSDGFDRAMWMFMICVVAGLGCVIAQHLFWLWYGCYCVAGAIWGGVTRKWWNVIISPISGVLIGSIIFLVH